MILLSVLGLRGGRNFDRLQRTYYEGGILAGEDEGICSVLVCLSGCNLCGLTLEMLI